MTEREAADIREDYEQALLGIWGFTDDGLKFVTGGHKDPEIWTTIDPGDLKIIVDSRLRKAQRNAKVAASVHRTIDLYEQGAVYLILGPRMWQSLQFIAENGLEVPLKNPFRKRRRMRVVPSTESEFAGD